MASSHRGAIEVLRESHEHASALVATLGNEELSGPSYCSEWSAAQVLSHLGSGAEIARLNLEAARRDAPGPERSDYEAIWARWNALGAKEMAEGFLAADDAHIAEFESIPDAELDALAVPAFGGRVLDATGAVLMRLGEHAVHSWDVEVIHTPEATLQSRPAELLVDRLGDRAARLGRGEPPKSAPTKVAIATVNPARSLVLSFEEEVALVEGSAAAPTQLRITSEALIRLFYGRLDAAHTPAGTEASGEVSLAELRQAFPGF